MGLIAEIQNDLEDGALKLIEEYRDRLFAEAVRLCGDPVGAEDLVIMTFDRAIRNLDKFKRDENLFGWLKTILTNLHTDDVRHTVNHKTEPMDSSLLEPLAGADDDAIERILKRSDHDALREAIARLDPEYKKALVMHYFSELPVKNVALALNLPIGTVLWRLNVARKMLANDLGKKLGKKPVAVVVALFLAFASAFGAWKAADALGWLPASEEPQVAESPLCVATAPSPSSPAETTTISKTNNETEDTNKPIGSTDMNLKTTKTFAAVAATAMTMTVSAANAESVNLAVDRVQQRYPWNNLVDIDYTVSGFPDDADPMDYYFDVTIRATVNGEPIKISASNFVNYAWCDLPVTNGTWRATWDSAADGVDFRTEDLRVELKLCKRVIAKSEADYMIVDISGGKNAITYPIRYVIAPNAPTRLFNTALYKTDRIVLKRVSAGQFTMGANVNGFKPVHTVVLTKDFFAGIFLVTQRQYELVVGTCPSTFKTDAPGNPAAQRPVESIGITGTILGSNGFLDRLNKKMSDHGCAETGMSIPTEAQIDYLTRAGVQTEYLWGDSWNAEEAKKYSWYFGNSGKTTHAVGQLLPNNWGFYDVVGNAAVWCPDCVCNYDADPNYDAETNTATDPVGGASGNFVLRGSSYITDQTGSKMTLWYRNSSWSRASSDSGFRLSLVLP